MFAKYPAIFSNGKFRLGEDQDLTVWNTNFSPDQLLKNRQLHTANYKKARAGCSYIRAEKASIVYIGYKRPNMDIFILKSIE